MPHLPSVKWVDIVGMNTRLAMKAKQTIPNWVLVSDKDSFADVVRCVMSDISRRSEWCRSRRSRRSARASHPIDRVWGYSPLEGVGVGISCLNNSIRNLVEENKSAISVTIILTSSVRLNGALSARCCSAWRSRGWHQLLPWGLAVEPVDPVVIRTD